MSPRKKIVVFGTFDLLHLGHRDLFRQAARLGQLTVVVARDHNIKRIKKQHPTHSERSRLASVAHDPNVSSARLGHANDFLQPIVHLQPNIIALGYDQKTFSISKLRTALKKRGLTPQIIRLRPFYPAKYKSSKLKKFSK